MLLYPKVMAHQEIYGKPDMFPSLRKDYRQRFPQIDESEIRILWHCAFYDGARSGVALYSGKNCWFEIVDDDPDFRDWTDRDGTHWKDWYARFLLIELTELQFREEKYWNDLFREKVGTHWDYDEKGKRKPGTVHPEESHNVFYDAVKDRKPRDFSTNRVVGWFETLWGRVETDEV